MIKDTERIGDQRKNRDLKNHSIRTSNILRRALETWFPSEFRENPQLQADVKNSQRLI